MFLLGATLAMGFALSAYMISTAMVRMRQQHTLRVKGLSEANVHSDIASWTCSYCFRGTNLPEVYAGLERTRGAVLGFLTDQQVPESEISPNPAGIEVLYTRDAEGNQTNIIEGYVLRASVSIHSGDVARVQRLAREASRLIRDGYEVEAGSPQYVYSKLESVKLDLLAKATQNAYERAQTLATNSNSAVGRLISGSQGVFQVTSPDSQEISDYGSFDTTSIDKSVKCVVTLEFAVQQ